MEAVYLQQNIRLTISHGSSVFATNVANLIGILFVIKVYFVYCHILMKQLRNGTINYKTIFWVN